MPAVSVIVPAYNVQDYITECLDSISQQTFEDIEIICIDDGSTDETVARIEAKALDDERIRLIQNSRNIGQYASRHIGSAASTGTYCMYVDGDDTIEPCACEVLLDRVAERPVDILHFGTNIVPEPTCPEAVVRGLEKYTNPPERILKGKDILTACFLNEAYDHNICHKLFRGELVRSVFSELGSNETLRVSEDAVEYFMLALHARTYSSISDARFYNYHVGRGSTGQPAISRAQFVNTFREGHASMRVLEQVLQRPENQRFLNDPVVQESFESINMRSVAHVMNIWQDSLPLEDRLDALAEVRGLWTDDEMLAELERFIRDDAYHLVVEDEGADSPERNRLHANLQCREALFGGFEYGNSENRLLYEMHASAEQHLKTLRIKDSTKERAARFLDSHIKIFVATHKHVVTPELDSLFPIQVGTEIAAERFVETLHDDVGANISVRNRCYCELTAQYWAWKNVDAEYYGFCHYRRYFNFSDSLFEENRYGEVVAGRMTAAAMRKYGLDDATIKRCIDGYDVLTTGIKELEEFPGDAKTPYEQYEAAPYLHIEDLERAIGILCCLYPEYEEDALAFLTGGISCFCNMYILRKDIFFDYCEWLFPILEQFIDQTDMSHYSKEALRTPGHIAERLFNIYLLHHMHNGSGWKVKELQCVHFMHPDESRSFDALPATEAKDPIIPIAFAADESYVPMLTTTILSVLENASEEYHYDIVVFERNISSRTKERMRCFFACYENATLRFYNVEPYIAGFQLNTNNEHISIETYYRFIVQDVLSFYDKVIYLDSDLLVLDDISRLYDIDLGDNLVAAVRDIDYLGNLNMNDGIRMEYTKEVLNMKDPYAYFQAGVLVMNATEMRKLHSVEEWMELVSQSTYIYDDQDILNSQCEGRVHYLEAAWNVMHDCMGRVGKVFSFAPDDVLNEYMAAREAPRIIHYAGAEKPWVNGFCDYAFEYWEYASRTPFAACLTGGVPKEPVFIPREPNRNILSDNSLLRRIVDPIAPLGTARREAIKSAVRFIRGGR